MFFEDFRSDIPELGRPWPRYSCKPALALVGEVAKDRIN